MPKLVGKSTRVVEHDGLSIDEFAGNVASNEDTLSIARVVITTPSSEPWLTLDYDEWICVLNGKMVIQFYNQEKDLKTMTFVEGQTCFIGKGERFRPTFPDGNTEYIPVCIPAFKPERCLREEEGVSDVSKNLNFLHSKGVDNTSSKLSIKSDMNAEKLYHMCQKSLWDQAISSKSAYFPPTYEQDGFFTHATSVPERLLETANHFYTQTSGDWICLELSCKSLHNSGICTRFEEAKPVGDASVSDNWGEWACPHIYGGIPGHVNGVVENTYKIERDDKGSFLFIDGITSTK